VQCDELACILAYPGIMHERLTTRDHATVPRSCLRVVAATTTKISSINSVVLQSECPNRVLEPDAVVSACMKVSARDRVLYRVLQYYVERMIAAHLMGREEYVCTM
jgi:hypothetical protein